MTTPPAVKMPDLEIPKTLIPLYAWEQSYPTGENFTGPWLIANGYRVIPGWVAVRVEEIRKNFELFAPGFMPTAKAINDGIRWGNVEEIQAALDGLAVTIGSEGWCSRDIAGYREAFRAARKQWEDAYDAALYRECIGPYLADGNSCFGGTNMLDVWREYLDKTDQSDFDISYAQGRYDVARNLENVLQAATRKNARNP